MLEQAFRVTQLTVDVGHRLDLDLKPWVDERADLHQGGRRTVVFAEVLDAQRIDAWAFGDICHEDGDLDDMFRARSGVTQARVHTSQCNAKLVNSVRRNGPVLLRADGARHPHMAVGTNDVAVVAEGFGLSGYQVAFDHVRCS